MKKEITTLGIQIGIQQKLNQDYFSLTDIAKFRNRSQSDDIIKNWLRNRNTIELLGLWEKLYNPNFKPVEFDGFRKESGLNSFVLTPKKWIQTTNAIGIVSTSGRYGGTFAHKDIAFEFASWISIEFKLYLIKEFQRLKEAEANQLNIQWSVQRTIAKINYKIHTDAIKENLIPETLTKDQVSMIYANEADLLNVALFGMTAQQFKEQNPSLEGNMRDQATLEQLVVLSNMESINALLIQQGLTSVDRIIQLNQVAITQMKSLIESKKINLL
ncbi:MAG: KilA-N domain-containing protein [Crocinitomicaceae bacterium]|nr:KilA-N domain-containing protein [Crocinitomicaceae bacterium]